MLQKKKTFFVIVASHAMLMCLGPAQAEDVEARRDQRRRPPEVVTFEERVEYVRKGDGGYEQRVVTPFGSSHETLQSTKEPTNDFHPLRPDAKGRLPRPSRATSTNLEGSIWMGAIVATFFVCLGIGLLRAMSTTTHNTGKHGAAAFNANQTHFSRHGRSAE
ncbi:MAG: hypothetical protein KDB27_15980 [Planctomycetales bacterium]|nr:hypothetical protein [Planctomycetales bacterium]